MFIHVDNNHIGALKDVLQYAANDVYVIKGDDGKEYFNTMLLTKFVPNYRYRMKEK